MSNGPEGSTHPRAFGIEDGFEPHGAASAGPGDLDVDALVPGFGKTFGVNRRQCHGLTDSVAEGGRCSLSHDFVTQVDRLAAKRHGIRRIENDGKDR